MKHSLPPEKALRASEAREVVLAALSPYAHEIRMLDVRVEYDAMRTWLVATLLSGRVLFVSERGASVRTLDTCIDTMSELLAREVHVDADRPSRVIVKNQGGATAADDLENNDIEAVS